MITAVTAKEARTRTSSGRTHSPCQASDLLKDERLDDWTPTRISDRKLIELNHRLERLRCAGDAFADVVLSPEAWQRLKELGIGR